MISLLLGRSSRSTFIVVDTSGFVEAISFIHFVLSFFLQFDGPVELWLDVPGFDLAKLPTIDTHLSCGERENVIIQTDHVLVFELQLI